jgi:glycosyltransferase involved in cell wall biosynthesis
MNRLAPHLRYTIDLAFDNREMSVGMKRQKLIQESKSKYSAFIDDDDEITDAYIEDMYKMIQESYPVMRLRGRIDPYTFTHSLENTLKGAMARGEVFLRPPNHLNPMMTDVAKLIHYKDALRGEDLDWTIRMARTRFLTSEYRSDDSRIHYIYNMGDRKVDPGSITFQKNTSYETMLSMVWTPNGAQAPTPHPPPPTGLRLTSRGFVSK